MNWNFFEGQGSDLDQAGKIRILVVEDYRELAQAFAAFFEMENFLVVIESDPLAVLKIAGHERFDVFMIDVGLDNISGMELARRLRKMPLTEKAFLIAVTGLGENLRQTCINAGFDGFFTKPIDVRCIAKILIEKFNV